MQAAGHLVAVAAELAACVELRQHDGHGRHPLLGDDLDRDAAAAISHRDRVVGVDRHLDRLVIARKGLIDRVVDHLGDEVMQAPWARRADVHTGAQPDRLEAFEHGDVLGRVAGLCLGLRHSQEMPAKPWFCEAQEVYQIGGSERPLARPKLTAFCTLSRRASSVIDEAIAEARSTSSGATASTDSRGSGSASGSAPGAKRTPGTPSAAAISADRCPSSNDQIESAVETMHGSVSRDPRRPGVAGDRRTDSLGPALDDLGHSRLRAEPRERAPNCVTEQIHVPPLSAARARAAALRRVST